MHAACTTRCNSYIGPIPFQLRPRPHEASFDCSKTAKLLTDLYERYCMFSPSEQVSAIQLRHTLLNKLALLPLLVWLLVVLPGSISRHERIHSTATSRAKIEHVLHHQIPLFQEIARHLEVELSNPILQEGFPRLLTRNPL
jgi:hypothetical protein